MEAVAAQKAESFAELQGTMRQDHDLVHELSNRLDTLWHYGECINNAEGQPDAQKVWRDLQRHELASIRELKQLVLKRVEEGYFLEDL